MTQAKFIKRSPPGCIVTGAEKLQKGAKNRQKLSDCISHDFEFSFYFANTIICNIQMPPLRRPYPLPILTRQLFFRNGKYKKRNSNIHIFSASCTIHSFIKRNFPEESNVKNNRSLSFS